MRMNVVEAVEKLDVHGYVRVAGCFRTFEEAFDFGKEVAEMSGLHHGLLPLSVIGDFVVPPLDGSETRDFQTLHLDFGLPLDPKIEQDVAFYTALFVPADVLCVQAETRLVPLNKLLGQRSWPPLSELIHNFCNYGRTHGAWDDDRGYVEGSLARIVEAADSEHSPALPSVKVEPDFLCGMEFGSIPEEVEFFEARGLRLHEAELRIQLQPGDLMIFNNMAVAHGRRGTRQQGELRQRVYGQRLHAEAQSQLRDGVLAAFRGRQ